MRCQECKKEVSLPFRCPYCRDYFCSEHRLPENHNCPRIDLARAPRMEEEPTILKRQKWREHTVPYSQSKPIRKVRFSNIELRHLTIATLLVTVIGLSSNLYPGVHIRDLISVTIVLTASFLMHEMAHKITAQIRGFWAEFRLIFTGAILTLISIVSPFKIISPGAIMISGFIDKESMGKISISGPFVNVVLSMVFFAATFIFPIAAFKLGAAFNAWIALFNLIPFGMFDGFKIFMWNKAVWALAFAQSLVLTLVCYMYVIVDLLYIG